MSKKITITISNEHDNKLSSLAMNSEITAITKSSIVALALVKFLDDATVSSVETEFCRQIKGDA